MIEKNLNSLLTLKNFDIKLPSSCPIKDVFFLNYIIEKNKRGEL